MRRSVFVASFIVLALVVAACGSGQQPTPETVVETQVVEKEVTKVVKETEVVEEEVVVTATPEPAPEEPVTFDGYSTTDIPTLDPQVSEDVVSINYTENLFVNLTNYDLETQDIVPEAATDWTVSDDGLVYTFTLRTDIPWVKHNPVTGETVQETDADGNPRFVTAQDFAYGITRACDPNIGSYYSTVIAPIIAGCEDVLNLEDSSDEDALAAAMDAVGVNAPDDATLVVELEFPASYFMTMTPMWTLAATPSWAIEEHGDEWVEAGNIVTNGRFVLSEWVHGVRRQIVRNPLMPEDMQGSGNIQRYVASVVPDNSTGYALWLNNDVDVAGRIPDAELESHLEEFPDETRQVPNLAVFYIGFAQDKPPFDDPHVRRAFSAAYDRGTHVEVVELNQGLPMKHFAPPGIFGAPPIDEVGVGYDPEYAREQLAEAGYPNCEGFPRVSLLGYSGEHTINWIEFAQAQWEENLGCSSDLIQIEQQTFAELLATTEASTPVEERPHMWTLGWGPDYPDENNWVGDVLWCENPQNRFQRECTETDDLIVEARQETDPARRKELYRQVEENFFSADGEMPFAPVYLQIIFQAEHSWVDRTVALFGGQQWYNWTVDWEAKQAARE